jgi:hypothetical protein
MLEIFEKRKETLPSDFGPISVIAHTTGRHAWTCSDSYVPAALSNQISMVPEE